jgi:hypothetical protein
MTGSALTTFVVLVTSGISGSVLERRDDDDRYHAADCATPPHLYIRRRPPNLGANRTKQPYMYSSGSSIFYRSIGLSQSSNTRLHLTASHRPGSVAKGVGILEQSELETP